MPRLPGCPPEPRCALLRAPLLLRVRGHGRAVCGPVRGQPRHGPPLRVPRLPEDAGANHFCLQPTTTAIGISLRVWGLPLSRGPPVTRPCRRLYHPFLLSLSLSTPRACLFLLPAAQVLDEGALRVDPKLDDFLREHFAREGDEEPLQQHQQQQQQDDEGAAGERPAAAAAAAAGAAGGMQMPSLGPGVQAFASGASTAVVQSALAMQLSRQKLQQQQMAPASAPEIRPSPSPRPAAPAATITPERPLSASHTAVATVPAPLPRPSAPRVPKLLLVGIDGCRPDALMMSGTPNIDELVFGKARSDRRPHA